MAGNLAITAHKREFLELNGFSCVNLFQNRFQAAVFDLVNSRKFEMFIIVVITINMIVMMVQHYNQPKEVTLVLDILYFKSINILNLRKTFITAFGINATSPKIS